MVKHKLDAISKEEQDMPPSKAAKITVACEYCNKKFTTRGISRHQRGCKKTPYRFYFVNEVIHEEILSFLGNQALTKLQMITGDRYRQCEAKLAKVCCKCENDNPIISEGLCRHCARGFSSLDYDAVEHYGLTYKELNWLKPKFRDDQQNLLVSAEEYMIHLCGSKIEWLRHISKLDIQRNKERKIRKVRERNLFLRRARPDFAAYIREINFQAPDKFSWQRCHQRFVRLKARLDRGCLSLLVNSTLCKDYIFCGTEDIDVILDSIK
ncbi:uncharacterized protein CCR75_006199 [Bremia lactucae]|uniref:Uncharacterized protein n=1 Tax=Bremia lactucae TaxID=4779 RepID=A0A976FG34_BRELC|nr:hypothetical protein CCR75_006199 [Bremia lactucae]